MDIERLVRFSSIYGNQTGDWYISTPLPNYVIRVRAKSDWAYIEIINSDSEPYGEIVFDSKQNIYKPGTWKTLVNAVINHEGALE